MKKFVLGVALSLAFAPSAAVAGSLGKVRGPFDDYRQFTAHFEFSVPRDVSIVRECVVGEINRAAELQGFAAPKFKSKLSKRKGVSIERLSWKRKSDSGYTFDQEVTFASGDGWTHVDTDNVFAETYEETATVEPGRDGLVGLHARCGLALDEPAPASMWQPLAVAAGDDSVVLAASSPKALFPMVQCIRTFSDDVGSAYLSTTFEADHRGSFYAYYIANYKNLGATQRLDYALKISPNDGGTRLEILAPGVSLGGDSPDSLRQSVYAVDRIEKCGGIFDGAAAASR